MEPIESVQYITIPTGNCWYCNLKLRGPFFKAVRSVKINADDAIKLPFNYCHSCAILAAITEPVLAVAVEAIEQLRRDHVPA